MKGRLTFALHALAEQAFEQAFAVLADSGACVGVNDESMGYFNPSQHHLLHPDGPATPGRDPLPCFLMRALLLEVQQGWRHLYNLKTRWTNYDCRDLPILLNTFWTLNFVPRKLCKVLNPNILQLCCIYVLIVCLHFKTIHRALIKSDSALEM